MTWGPELPLEAAIWRESAGRGHMQHRRALVS